MKKIFVAFVLAFALVGGMSAVMTIHSQPAVACNNSDC